jgi:hypothetical protein
MLMLMLLTLTLLLTLLLLQAAWGAVISGVVSIGRC